MSEDEMRTFRVFIGNKHAPVMIRARYAWVDPSGSLEFKNNRRDFEAVHAFARGHWQNFVDVTEEEEGTP